ncbi:uncharacterized protein LOC134716124 isoform X3 [Mytilus trossulus]|uniref:uncharacterized protein LOC134716124 isoform X3 n=1 Tax=Mytilus trossulus TaxID=6551 RepID=UPI003007EA1F
MNREIIFAVVCTFIAAVNGVCDRQAVSTCYGAMQGSNENMQAQCAAYETVKTCIAPHKDECAGDPTLAALAGLAQLCGGGAGGAGGGTPPNIPTMCAVDTCAMSMQKYMPQGEGETPIVEASPEMCAAATQYKTCVENGRSQCPDSQSVKNAEMMIKQFESLCGGCATAKLMKCVQMLGSLAAEGFDGYPTHEQINTVCPKMNQFKTCVTPIKAKCAAIDNDQAKQITKGIEASLGMVDVMCGSEFKAGFMKHGMACFDKKSFKNATAANCDSMMAPKPEPETTGKPAPESESKAQECQRTSQMFECTAQQVEAECDDEAVAFVQQVEMKFRNVVLGKLGCPTSGGVRLAAQTSVFLAFLLAAFFMY